MRSVNQSSVLWSVKIATYANICIHTYQCTCTDFLFYCTVCKHIHSVHRSRERSGSDAEQDVDGSEEQIDLTNECSSLSGELNGLVNMTRHGNENTNIEVIKRNAKNALLAIIGSLENSDERHGDAIRHLTKSANSLRHTFESMKKETKVVKLEPTIKANNKRIDTQRRFFSTTKRKKKGNIRFAKPTDSDKKNFALDEFSLPVKNENVEIPNSRPKLSSTPKHKGKSNVTVSANIMKAFSSNIHQSMRQRGQDETKVLRGCYWFSNDSNLTFDVSD